jgi:hypothetical protein
VFSIGLFWQTIARGARFLLHGVVGNRINDKTRGETIMAYDQSTARVQHEFSTGWIENNPNFAADRIAICIREIQDSGMDVSFDFSRHGFMTITGTR